MRIRPCLSVGMTGIFSRPSAEPFHTDECFDCRILEVSSDDNTLLVELRDRTRERIPRERFVAAYFPPDIFYYKGVVK